MNAMNMKAIAELLEKHRYQIQVETVNGTSINLTLPEIQHKDFASLIQPKTYQFAKSGVKINSKLHKIPQYTARPFILSDIVKNALQINYNPLFLVYIVDGHKVDEVSFIDSLKVKLTQEEQAKESKLRNLIVSYFISETLKEEDLAKLAKEQDVEEGFQRILKHLSDLS